MRRFLSFRFRLLPALAVLGCSAPAPPAHLLVVTLDTVRLDHLSAYGYHRPTTPRLAALAEDGVLFEQAIAQQTNTAPSHASIFTGLYPPAHGSRRNGEAIAPSAVPLAEQLKSAGFVTAAFVSGAPLRAAACGLDRGFDHYDDGFDGKRRPGEDTVDLALAWLAEQGALEQGTARRFLWVHLYDAHGPYDPPDDLGELFRSPDPGPEMSVLPLYQKVLGDDGEPVVRRGRLIDRYDRLLRHVDDQLGRLLDAIDRERAVIVVVADHGEILAERPWPFDHGASVFEAEIRVPLVLAAPSIEPARVAAMVETIDLPATLLDLLGLEPTAGVGRSLLPLLAGEPLSLRPAFSSSRSDPIRHPGLRLREDAFIDTVRTPRFKLIRYPTVDGDLFHLHDLRADPGELRDEASLRPDLRDRLASILRDHDKKPVEPDDRPLPDEVREQLRALGYAN